MPTVQGLSLRGTGEGMTEIVKKKKGLLKSEQRKFMGQIRKLIGKGKTDEDIGEELGLRTDQVQAIKRKIYQIDKVRFQNFDRFSVYSDYVGRSTQMVKELDEIKTKFRNRGQWTALVAAIKQKKDIFDSVIKMGQDFGFIDKKATEVKIEGEMSFSTMTDKDIQAEIAREVERMHQIAKGNVVEMRPELLGVTDEDVQKFVPANLVRLPAKKENRMKMKTKVKVSLKKRV